MESNCRFAEPADTLGPLLEECQSRSEALPPEERPLEAFRFDFHFTCSSDARRYTFGSKIACTRPDCLPALREYFVNQTSHCGIQRDDMIDRCGGADLFERCQAFASFFGDFTDPPTEQPTRPPTAQPSVASSRPPSTAPSEAPSGPATEFPSAAPSTPSRSGSVRDGLKDGEVAGIVIGSLAGMAFIFCCLWCYADADEPLLSYREREEHGLLPPYEGDAGDYLEGDRQQHRVHVELSETHNRLGLGQAYHVDYGPMMTAAEDEETEFIYQERQQPDPVDMDEEAAAHQALTST